METEPITILLLGDEKVGKTTFLSYVAKIDCLHVPNKH